MLTQKNKMKSKLGGQYEVFEEQSLMARGHIMDGYFQTRLLIFFRYGEKMLGTLNSLATVVLDPVTSVLKDSARPAYWVPDEDCFDCCVCKKPFDTQQSSSSNSLSNSCASPGSSTSTSKIKLHHCRQCK